jgi:hypothetical protein
MDSNVGSAAVLNVLNVSKAMGIRRNKTYPLPLHMESRVEEGKSYIIFHKTLGCQSLDLTTIDVTNM